MGRLSRLNPSDLVRAYGLDTLVETGTGHGHSVITALQVPEITHIVTIEVDYETYHRNTVTFSNEPRVTCLHGDSSVLLPKVAADLTPNRRVLWFLDAHFAGSGRLAPLPMEVKNGDVEAAAPVLTEVKALIAYRGAVLANDVIVIDDLCLFEEGPYEVDARELRMSLGQRSLAWMDLLMTHTIERVYHDGGYLIARPR